MIDKAHFLKKEMFALLEDFSPSPEKRWGKMDAQQMLEHLRDFFMVSTGKLQFDIITPEAHLPKYLEFLRSEKPFRENTKAPSEVLGDEPLPYRFNSLADAKHALEKSVYDFFEYFSGDSDIKTLHPVFGLLNFDDWILLHYKHVQHHFRQFSLID